MPATLSVSLRYTDQANTRVYYLSSILDPGLMPTRSELDGGWDLSGEICDISGWQVVNNKLDVLTLDSIFATKRLGLDNVATSSLGFYTSKNGTDIRTILSRGTRGYVAFLDGGDVTGYIAQVFPVFVTSVGVIRTAVGKDASKVTVQFAVTSAPALAVTVPAGGASTGHLFPMDILYPDDGLYPDGVPPSGSSSTYPDTTTFPDVTTFPG